MDKRMDKRLLIVLSGILMSRALATSVPSYAENNEEIEPELSMHNLNEINTIKTGKVTTSSLNVRANASTKLVHLKKEQLLR